MAHANQLPSQIQASKRLLRIRDVMRITGLSRSYIYALAAQGKFPQSLALVPGGTSRAWLESEVEEWLDERIAARDLGDE
ncbi:helix-turn-helix transcriptional regulator [Litorivivens sp.]|uniref:helix-turn-helix transcriptional regulator n=1 Tax=Litorivivens sp. TaxID=2020868 RepID=UPI003561C90B